MASNREHIDEVFKKLSDLKTKPKPIVWDGVEAELKAKNKNISWFTLKYAAGFIGLLFLGLGFLFSLKKVSTAESFQSSHAYQQIFQEHLFNNLASAGSETENTISSSVKEEVSALLVSSSLIDSTQATQKYQIPSSKLNRSNFKKIQDSDESSPSTSIAAVEVDFFKALYEISFLHQDFDTKVKPLLLKDIGLISTSSSATKNDLLETFNTLEESIVQVEETPRILSRFSVTPGVSPIFSGGNSASSFSQGINESSQGNTNLSYGLQVAYQVTEKLSVRTGVHQVGAGFQTDNMVVTYQSRPEELPTISTYANTNISIMDSKTFSEEIGPSARIPFDEASLNQELGFVEIPMEAAYQFVDQKIGVSLIGGMSTLFLNQNRVVANLQEDSFVIGESTNVNSTSFSANLGFGLAYKFTDKIKFNLEPSLRYQINTFDSATTDFKPYFIGIFSGIKFQF